MNAGFLGVVTWFTLWTAIPAAAQHPRPAPQPPAPAALSVPNPLRAFEPGPRDLYQGPDGSDRFQHLSRHPVPPVFAIPGGYFPASYYYMPYAWGPDYRPFLSPKLAPTGRLTLETVPDHTQVFVDGFYVGLAQEFGLRGRALELSAGAHHIELRAIERVPVSFSVMIAPNEVVRYRGDLQTLHSAAAPVAAPAAPATSARKSYYVIPNCYAGDRPPSSGLPSGCDLKNLKTRR